MTSQTRWDENKEFPAAPGAGHEGPPMVVEHTPSSSARSIGQCQVPSINMLNQSLVAQVTSYKLQESSSFEPGPPSGTDHPQMIKLDFCQDVTLIEAKIFLEPECSSANC